MTDDLSEAPPADTVYGTTDPVWPGILPTAGSELLYRAAAGLEKAEGDVDGQRMTAVYAELVRDQWNPYAISARNLPFLAWAMGVNLWENDWDDTFRRWWVANQWTLKEQRGSLLGTVNFVRAVGGRVVSAIVPPAKFFPGKKTTDAEKAAYVARFPQLRLYPYVARAQLPYVCFTSNFLTTNATELNYDFSGQTLLGVPPDHGSISVDAMRSVISVSYTDTDNADNTTFLGTVVASGTIKLTKKGDVDTWATFSVTGDGQPGAGFCQIPVRMLWSKGWFVEDDDIVATFAPPGPATYTRKHNRNGCFMGPLWKFYPTHQNAGGRYTMTSTLWDYGVETPLTTRKITMVDMGVEKTVDEILVTKKLRSMRWYVGEGGKWFLPKGHPLSQNRHSIFLGVSGTNVEATVVRVPSDDGLDITQGKAIYQTVSPGLAPIDVYPDIVATTHAVSKRSLFCGGGQFLFNKFMPPSKAWQFMYKRWYLFDPARVPDYRRASVYMGHARLGIHRYTAELKIDITAKMMPFYIRAGGFMRGYFRPANTDAIDKLRRAVTASMALRDTIRIDTKIKRTIQVADAPLCDGSFYVNEMVDA